MGPGCCSTHAAVGLAREGSGLPKQSTTALARWSLRQPAVSQAGMVCAAHAGV